MSKVIVRIVKRIRGTGRVRCAFGRVLLCVVVSISAVRVASAETDQENHEAKFGIKMGSDYSAKHFSLMTGAVILNPFKIKKDMNDPSKLELDHGTTDVNFFLELGFRYRWTWLDRVSRAAEAKADWEDAEEKLEVAKAKAKTAADGQELALRRARGSSDSEVEAVQRAVLVRQEESIAPLETAVVKARNEYQRAVDDWRRRRDEAPYESLPSRFHRNGGKALLPDDFAVRMGLAFPSTDASGAAGLIGASDFYSEFTTGWNLVTWSFRTSNALETPIRAAVSFEPSVQLSTDNELNDIHERYLIGPSISFGVPLTFLPPKKKTATADETEKDPPGVDGDTEAKAQSPQIVELVARFGAVNVETLQFKDSQSREIETKHGDADFQNQWGAGFDIEMNVPVPGDLGYLSARGILNAGFDPNPWTLLLGYTIPLGKLADAITTAQ